MNELALYDNLLHEIKTKDQAYVVTARILRVLSTVYGSLGLNEATFLDSVKFAADLAVFMKSYRGDDTNPEV